MDSKPFSQNFLKHLAISRLALTILVLIIAGLTLIEWLFRANLLLELFPSHRIMKFNTALAFLSLCMGIFLFNRQEKLVQILALVTFALGLATLLQYLFAWDLGIDELFVKDRLNSENPFAGRMSPISTILFCLLASALFLKRTHRLIIISQVIALVAAFIALLAVVGYFYGVQALYRISTFSSIPIETAICFIFIALAIFMTFPKEGIAAWIFSGLAGGQMAQRLLWFVIILPLGFGWLRLKGQEIGLYDTNFGLAIFALSNVLVFSILVFATAYELNQIDGRREEALHHLQKAHDELEAKVLERTRDIEQVNQDLAAEILERQALEIERDSFFALSIDMLGIASFDNHFKSVNAAFERILGFSQEELLERPFSEFIYAEDLNKLQNELERLRDGHSTINFEIRFICKDDSLKWTAWTAQPIPAIGLVYIVGRDISEQKRAAELLQAKTEQEHELQGYLFALQKIVIELSAIESLDAFYKAVVDLGLEYFGFERLGLLLYEEEQDLALGTYGTDRNGLIRDESHIQLTPSKLTNILARSIQNQEILLFDENTELFDNFEFIGRGQNAVAVIWNGKEKFGWLAIDNAIKAEEISYAQLEILVLYAMSLWSLLAQKQAIINLAESELRYRTVVSTLSEGLLLQDKTGRIQTSNQAAETILGLSLEQMMGLTSLDPRWRAIYPDGSPFPNENHPAMLSLKSGKSYEDVQLGIFKPDNSLSWILINSTPIFEAGIEEVSGVVVSFRDITRQRELEKAAFESALERERTQLLNQFIQNSSHEFRTPLTIIRTSLYVLSKTDEVEKRQLKIKTIEEQIVRINKLVDMLVKLANLDSGVAFNFVTQDLNLLIKDLCQQLAKDCAAQNLSLNLELAATLPQVQLDTSQMQEALQQIIENAIRHTEAGGSIKISSQFNAERVIISIRDTGSGIPEEAMGHIFERFYRVDTAHSTPGFGLGLAIAKSIVEKHSGEIRIESQVGQGSLFEIILKR